MPRKLLLAFVAALVAIALPAGAGADVYSLLDYQSATDALKAAGESPLATLSVAEIGVIDCLFETVQVVGFVR
jgi:hypothetical protein